MKQTFRNHKFMLIREVIDSFVQVFYLAALVMIFDLKLITTLSLSFVVFIMLICYKIAKWYNQMYEVNGDYIVGKSGVFTKKENKIRFESVQTADIKQTFMQRLFNVNTITIDTGTMRDTTGMQLLLSVNDARILQHLVLQYEELEVTKDSHLFKLKEKDLWLFALTRSNILAMIIILFSGCVLLGSKFWVVLDYVVYLKPVVFFFVILLVFIVLKLIVMVQTYLSHKNYKIEKQDQLLKVSHGYFTRKSYSVQIDRITCVQLNQTLVQKLLGYCMVKVVAMGYGNADDIEPTLIPLIKVDEFEELFGVLFAEFKVESDVVKPGAQSQFSYYVKSLIALGILVVLSFKLPLTLALSGYVLVAWRLINARLRFKQSQILYNHDVLCVRSGGFNVKQVFVKFNRVDSLTYSCNYFQRKFDLARFEIAYESRAGFNECVGLGYDEAVVLDMQKILQAY